MKLAILATFNFPMTKKYDLRPEALMIFFKCSIIFKYEANNKINTLIWIDYQIIKKTYRHLKYQRQYR